MPEIKIPADIAAMNFEQALAELETLVAKMENGGLPMNELMNDFERGCQLTGHCRKQLAIMERKISMLVNDDGKDGQWTDFDESSGKRVDDEFLPF